MAHFNAMKLAAFFVGISAVLHLTSILGGGIAAISGLFVVAGLVYVGVAYGLWRAQRWLAWVAFFWIFIGAIVSQSLTGSGAIPDWALTGIVLANLAAVVCLFGALWRTARRQEV